MDRALDWLNKCRPPLHGLGIGLAPGNPPLHGQGIGLVPGNDNWPIPASIQHIPEHDPITAVALDTDQGHARCQSQRDNKTPIKSNAYKVEKT